MTGERRTGAKRRGHLVLSVVLLVGCYQHHSLGEAPDASLDAGTEATPLPLPPRRDAGPEPAPEPPPVGSRAVALAAGLQHVCALTDVAEVYCWGANDAGQSGRYRPLHTVDAPARVRGLPPVVQIAAGWFHTCALDEDGRLWCWGNSGQGQLGVPAHAVDSACGRAECSPEPLAFEAPAAGAVYAAEHVTCGRMRGGPLQCWGERRGDGLPTSELGALEDFGLGIFHGCALTHDGSVRCFGEDEFGRLGDGGSGDGAVDLPDVVELEVGHDHACALDGEDRVWCWGMSAAGSVGRPDAELARCVHEDRAAPCAETPVRPTGNPSAVALSAGGFHSCVLDGTGAVRCWGQWQVDASVRDFHRVDRSEEELTTVEGLDDPIGIEVGASVACAVESNGEVRCWGSNARGQLGVGGATATFHDAATRVVGFGR